MTVYMTNSIWRRISKETRREVLSVLPRNRVVGRYTIYVLKDLTDRGAESAAWNLLAEVEYIKDYRGEFGVLPPPPRNHTI